MEMVYQSYGISLFKKKKTHLKIVHISELQDGRDTDEIFKYNCSFQMFHHVACQQVLIFRGL